MFGECTKEWTPIPPQGCEGLIAAKGDTTTYYVKGVVTFSHGGKLVWISFYINTLNHFKI